VNASKSVKIELVSRTKSEIEIRKHDRSETYQISKEFPFNSDRKWMSVMVKTSKGTYELLTKGADNVMENRIKWTNNMKQEV